MKYSPYRHIDSILVKNRPIHLTFFLTKRCNAKCSFCFYIYQDQDKNKSNRQIIQDELSLEEIERISTGFGNLLWLAFSGGEIFLRDDLVEITKIFYKKNKPAIILFPTNGLMPDKIFDLIQEIVKHCKKSMIVVKLSLDGPRDLHNSIRGSKKSFQKTLETYKKLSPLVEKYQNFELGINTVFCTENQYELDELFEEVKKLDKIRTHTVSLIRGNVKDETLLNIDMEKYKETINKLRTDLNSDEAKIYKFTGSRLKAAQDIVQRELIFETHRKNKRLIPCYAGKLNLVLTEDGQMFPCEILNQSMGNIREFDYNVSRLIDSDRAKKVISYIKKGSCHCTHECNFITNIMFNPMLYPSLLKEYLRLL